MGEAILRGALLANLAATLFMTGLIWLVQLVHYPMFDGVGAANFPEYHQRHTRRTTWVVGPPMLIEGITAVLLVAFPPTGVSRGLLLFGLGLVAVLWLSTALVQVPLHNRLAVGFDSIVHRRLVTTNWVRTAAWSLRAAMILGVTIRMELR